MVRIVIPDSTNESDFAIVGRINASTAPEFERYIEQLPLSEGSNVRIDLSECEFISSAGLRAIIAMQKKISGLGGKLVFTGVRPDVMGIFLIAGFERVLTFEDGETSS